MRLRELRELKGLSQKDFSSLIGVPANTYNQWEKEKRSPDYEMLSRIANYYEVSVDYLIGRDEVSIPEETKKPAEGELSELSEDEKLFLSLLRQVPESDRPSVDRMIKALIQGIADNQ